MVIDVKPAATLKEASDQMEEAIGLCKDSHYVNVCDTVLSRWSVICRSVDIDALLALSGRMEEMAGKGACLTPDGLDMAAASIREALGVRDG